MSHPDLFSITTDRLRFRPIRPGDEEYIFPEVDEELTRYYIGWEPSQSLEEERQRVAEKVERCKTSPNFEFMVFDTAGHFVGCCSLSSSESVGEYEVGFWVAHREQRKGYGKEMLAAALDWTRQHTDLTYVVYSYTEGNEASAAIIHKMDAPLFREVSYSKRGVQKRVYDHKIAL